jgi:hypothetical protein
LELFGAGFRHLDQTSTSQKETSFCVSLSTLKKRLRRDTELQTGVPLGVWLMMGSLTNCSLDQNGIQTVHDWPPRSGFSRGRFEYTV